MTTQTQDVRAIALANHLEIGVGAVTDLGYGNEYEVKMDEEDAQYRVLTDEERFEAAKEYIEETLYAFRPAFLSAYTGFPELVFEKLQDVYDRANEAIRALIEHEKDFDEFVEHVIDADGYGEFLAGYDGDQLNLGDGLYAYRIN